MTDKKRASLIRRRSAARLASVQALYQIELTDGHVEDVLNCFLIHRIGRHALLPDPVREDNEIEVPLLEPDSELLTNIVRGAWAFRDELTSLASSCLSKEGGVERLEAVLRAILRAGVYELSHNLETPPLVTISEYTDIARAFYGNTEVGLVNAVLDKVARQVRSGEMSDIDDGKKIR